MENTRITLGEDGIYRWTYHMNLIKNPSIFLLVLKVLLGTCVGIWVVMTPILCIVDESWDPLVNSWKTIGIVFAIIFGLTLIGYLVYAMIMGGFYIVDFTMDDKELVHTQVPRQQEKARKVSAVTAVVGALAKNPTTVSIGMTSGTKMSSTTEFHRLKKVIVLRRRHVIKLVGGGHNEAYAVTEDMDWLCDYIRAHCPAEAVWKIK
ncbi:MAG: hypothetical protein IKS10_09725 [Lachnospiraceae bacterium]|nr:hypothetical protein [Lachnospiraceae bacterium]